VNAIPGEAADGLRPRFTTRRRISQIAAKLRERAGLPKELTGEVNVPTSGEGTVDEIKDAIT
jgi:hypothetical protein